MGFEYPERIKLGILLSEGSKYEASKDDLHRIELLAQGGRHLRAALPKFLEQRTGEDDEVYAIRLSKFTYSNALGSGVASLASKFSNGLVQVEGIENDSFWPDFRANNNGCGRSEQELITQLFTQLVTLGSVFVHVDKPKSDIEPTNAAEEQALGLAPKAVVYSALQVPSWGEDDGRISWIKTFQICEVIKSPAEMPLTEATWTFIDDESIARYKAYVKVQGGKIVNLCNEKGEKLEQTDEESLIKLESSVRHGFNQVPVVRIELSDKLWSGNQAAALAEAALRLEMHVHDYLTNAYPQKTYKRVQRADSLDATFDDLEEEEIPTGLQFLVELENFSWNEPTGAILERCEAALEKTNKQIGSILSVGGAYLLENPAAAISGASKEVDFDVEDTRLEAYGRIFTAALQKIYRLVAIAAGKSAAAEKLTVEGLDNFSRRRLETLISILRQLLEIDMNALRATTTPTLYLLLREKLMSFLMSNLSPEQKKIVQEEIAAEAKAELDPESSTTASESSASEDAAA